MSSYGQRIAQARYAKGWSQSDLAAAVGTSQQQIARFESGTEVRASMLIKLSDALGVTVSNLLGIGTGNGFIKAVPGPSCQMPLVGRIAAGTAREAIYQTGETVEALVSTRDAHPRGFWLAVAGNSMNRLFPEGTLVLIDPDAPVRDGDVAVVFVNGDDATLKRVYFEGGAIRLHPESYDPEYQDRVIDKSDPDAPEVRIVGRAVTYMAPEDWRA